VQNRRRGTMPLKAGMDMTMKTRCPSTRSGMACEFCCMLLALWAFSLAPGVQAADYFLGPGDKIRVHVFGEPDLTVTLTVPSSGVVVYPFVGDLQLAGKTTTTLQDELTSLLQPDYLVDPRISVNIERYRPFFINGEVKNSGSIEFQPGLTLRKAVSLAGGFTERANRKEMTVISDDAPDVERRVGPEYQIQPGDLITVKDTFF